ncbi:MAG: T9SS type A sorting domain-containing protein [Flavobacteriales bacterium]|nr:T9SS type A sorting domain-containing protein [Flavobacteriales bacterium]
MKNSWLFAALQCICTIGSAQSPSIQWQRCLGGANEDWAMSIAMAWSGGYVVSGHTLSDDGDITQQHGGVDYGDAWVVKLAPGGAIEWEASFGGTLDDVASSIIRTVDSGYFFTGWTRSNDFDVSGNHSPGYNDAWAVKLDSMGILQWQRCLGGTGSDIARSALQTASGEFILIGSTSSGDGDVAGHHGVDDVWVVSLNANGELQWQKCLGSSSSDYGYSIEQTGDGGYVLAGWTTGNSGDVSGHHGQGFADGWLVKLDSEGNLEWQRCLGGTSPDAFYSVASTTDGGFAVAGYTSSTNGDVSGLHGNSDAWVVKVDAGGAIQWQRCLGGTGTDRAESVKSTSDGGFLVVGWTQSNNGDVANCPGQGNAWAVKLDSLGSIEWQNCLGGNSSEAFQSSIAGEPGTWIVAGGTSSSNGDVIGHQGYIDAWVVSLGPSAIGINEVQFTELSVTPNPTFASATVHLPTQAGIRSTLLLDATGRLTQVTGNSSQSESFTFDLSTLDSGLYFIHVHFQDGHYAVGRVVRQ